MLEPEAEAAAILMSLAAADALARAAATPVLHLSNRTFRFVIFRGCPTGKANNSSTHPAS